MKAEQISVFVENRAGSLARIIHLLGAAGVNIRALSLADSSDFGVLRMIVSDPDKAASLIKEAGFALGRAAVVAVEISDRPGALAAVLALMSGAGINVEYMYACARRNSDRAVMIFRFDKLDEAIPVLVANGHAVITGAELRSL